MLEGVLRADVVGWGVEIGVRVGVRGRGEVGGGLEVINPSQDNVLIVLSKVVVWRH